MNYRTRAELKDHAKECLVGRFGLLIRVFILSIFLTLLVFSISGSLFPGTTIDSILLGEAASLIVSAFTGLFSVGSAYIYLKLARGGDASLSDMFYAFTNNFQTSLGVSFLLGLISSIPTLTMLFLDLYHLSTGTADFVSTSICVFVAVILYFLLHLFTAQCEYLLIDEPEKSVREIFSMSAKLMTGNKKRLLLLILSFLPITFLAALSLIGVLWIIPYVSMTYALFYLELKEN